MQVEHFVLLIFPVLLQTFNFIANQFLNDAQNTENKIVLSQFAAVLSIFSNALVIMATTYIFLPCCSVQAAGSSHTSVETCYIERVTLSVHQKLWAVYYAPLFQEQQAHTNEFRQILDLSQYTENKQTKITRAATKCIA